MASSSEHIATARTSTQDSPYVGPISQFEHNLKYLSDSYLAFFQERIRAEEAYIDALSKLHKKAKTMDTYLDDRREPTTVRSVWVDVRDGLEREAQGRSAFVGALNVDVITPLLTLKETQERTRKRIREDIKESTIAHQDYLENVLPRLKRTYTKKCQEVEDNKATAATLSSPTGEAAPITQSRSQPSNAPVVTSPQPLRPLSRRASGHNPQPRNRSPSSSNPLQDLAHSGKRQLNQLMTFLDNKGGTAKDGLGSSRNDTAVRLVKAKREALEADKEYRKGVHWLETLRIRRMKILEAAFTSLELFIGESADKLKTVLTKYTENAIATSTTLTQLAKHARTSVDHIDPQKDTQITTAYVPRYMQQYCPRRTLYTNYYVGDCNDLIFGVSLVDYATSRGLQDGQIPKTMRICIKEIESRGLQTEGIYRISGRHAVVQEIIHRMEKDEKSFQFSSSDDVFVVSSLLKQYMRELPEPLFRFPADERVKHTEDIEGHIQNNFSLLRGKIRRLPPIHQAALKAIVEHLARVAANSDKNKMDVRNLAIIFGGFIFGEDEVPKTADLLTLQSWKDSLMEDLISNAATLFDDRSIPIPTSSSHPLPPEPAGEEPLATGYGSSHTQVSSVPATPPRIHHAKSESQSSGRHQDFTPQLPPRPSNSIHPSRRTQNHSTNSQSSSNRSGSETDDDSQRQTTTTPDPPPRPPGAAAPAIGPMSSEISSASDTNTITDAAGFTQHRSHTSSSGTSAADSEASPTSAQFESARSSPHSPLQELMSPVSALELPPIPQGGFQMSTEDLNGGGTSPTNTSSTDATPTAMNTDS